VRSRADLIQHFVVVRLDWDILVDLLYRLVQNHVDNRLARKLGHRLL